jgi:hypothetical protein
MYLVYRDVARPENGGGGEPQGQAKGIIVVICLLQKSYMQSWWHTNSWWHCRIAKGGEIIG